MADNSLPGPSCLQPARTLRMPTNHPLRVIRGIYIDDGIESITAAPPGDAPSVLTDSQARSGVDISTLEALFHRQHDEMFVSIDNLFNQQTKCLETQMQLFFAGCNSRLDEISAKLAESLKVAGGDVNVSDRPEAERKVSQTDQQTQMLVNKIPRPVKSGPSAGIDDPLGAFYEDNRRIFENLRDHIQGPHKHSRLFKEFWSMKGNPKSVWHEIGSYVCPSNPLATEMPKTFLAGIARHHLFATVSALLVMVNTCVMCYDSDNSMQDALEEQGREAPGWIGVSNMVFSVIFLLEVVFKMIALGTWFFVSPEDWSWNVFDLFVVIASILSDFVLDDANVSFLRALRFMRAARAARVVRVFRFFRELRKILLAIIASVKSLLWCFVFLAVTMLIISVLLLQGLSAGLNDMEPSEYAVARNVTAEFYGSIWTAMFTILRSCTGGDWHVAYEALTYAGQLYQAVFLLYILFVMVGIMNVLTGVFIASAGDFLDHDLVVQDFRIGISNFVKMMLDLFQELDLNRVGEVDWPTFEQAIKSDSVQAYLAAHGLETLHAHLIFNLLDETHTGRVNLFDFVVGMTNLKGAATAIDSRLIMRQVGLIPEVLHSRFTMTEDAD